jgi:hypothetical protein
MPIQPRRPPLFCLISPEASCEKRYKTFRIRNQEKENQQIKNAGKGLTEKRASVFCLWGEAFFCLDLLVTFVSRQK